MRRDHHGDQIHPRRQIERAPESLRRELRPHTSRELAILIMWPKRDPAIVHRYGRPLLDLYANAARAVLRERREDRVIG